MSLPNILTIFRLIAAPALALAVLFLARPLGDWVALCLFVAAAITDFLDGVLARRWGQISKLGTMLDPIADKAIVLVTLLTVVAIYGLQWPLVIPAVLIVFREVFVSGLREYLGDTAGTLKVTPLAKWKTTAQLCALGVLLTPALFEHGLFDRSHGMDADLFEAILAGTEDDVLGLRWLDFGRRWSFDLGLGLLWIAAVLTLLSGIDYFRKALPHVSEPAHPSQESQK